jgi:mono/diheme cytochrome c family protein
MPTPIPHRRRRAESALGGAAILGIVLFLLTWGTASAQEDTGPSDELIARGAAVYTDSCSGCHQPGGGGIPGQFPPLLGNPHVDDAEYVRGVLANGRTGELVVDGVTYDGRMPAFSTLPDSDVDAVIAFVQGGFVVPAGGGGAAETPGGTGGGLPDEADMMMTVAFVIAGAVALFVLLPRITSTHDGLEMPWLDASLKAALIVVGFIAFTVIVPDWALQTETVTKLDRPVQDFVGTALWLGGLVVTLGAVWYAHREKRI